MRTIRYNLRKLAEQQYSEGVLTDRKMNIVTIYSGQSRKMSPLVWGKLAREEHQVVPFKDTEINRFVAVAVDGGSLYTGPGMA